jgi:hypothetical protein
MVGGGGVSVAHHSAAIGLGLKQDKVMNSYGRYVEIRVVQACIIPTASDLFAGDAGDALASLLLAVSTSPTYLALSRFDCCHTLHHLREAEGAPYHNPYWLLSST